MAGYILHEGAVVQCLDAGKADPLAVNQRVKVSGQHIVTQNSTYTINGCILASSGTGTFCSSAQWIKAASRVKASGVAVVLDDSQAKCINTGQGLKVSSTQTRVKGT